LFFPPVRTCPHSISGCPWVCPGAAETREYSRVPAETLPDPSNSELDRGRHSGQTLAEGDTTNTAWFIFTSPPPCNLPVVGSFRAGTLNPQPSPPVPTHRRHRPTGRRHKAAGHLGDADTQYGRCARPILTRPMRPHDVVSSMIISSRTPWSRSVVPLFNSTPPRQPKPLPVRGYAELVLDFGFDALDCVLGRRGHDELVRPLIPPDAHLEPRIPGEARSRVRHVILPRHWRLGTRRECAGAEVT
jgi:hypothetical protein